MKKKRKISKKILLLFVMLFFICLFMFSVFKIVCYLKDNHDNKKIQKVMEESIIINNSKKVSKDEKYKIDFSSLKKQNPDTVAYLEVGGTNIKYVVVKGKDNSYYLNHNFNKKYNVSGWIFADYRNKFDGSDKNIVIYGHNTLDGSMFGTLKDTLERSWQRNKREIVLVTEGGTSIYEVFSTYSTEAEEYYINTDFGSEKDYNNFLNKLFYRSNYKYGIHVDKDDSILTLSSCTISGDKRVVLHAKKIDTEKAN